MLHVKQYDSRNSRFSIWMDNWSWIWTSVITENRFYPRYTSALHEEA